jgi:hypothetical protein
MQLSAAAAAAAAAAATLSDTATYGVHRWRTCYVLVPMLLSAKAAAAAAATTLRVSQQAAETLVTLSMLLGWLMVCVH